MSRVLLLFYKGASRRVPFLDVSLSFSSSSPSSRVSCLYSFPLFRMYHNILEDLVEDEEFHGVSEDEACSLPPEAFSPQKRAQLGSEYLKNYVVSPLRIRQPRSRPAIDFSSRGSTLRYPSSHVSGSTLYSRSNSFTVAHKEPSPFLSPSISVNDIASLTEPELFYNPIHKKLRKDYENVVNALAKYLGRDSSGPQVVPSTAFVPDIHHGM